MFQSIHFYTAIFLIIKEGSDFGSYALELAYEPAWSKQPTWSVLNV